MAEPDPLARSAWAYIVKNEDPTTGLAPSTESFPWCTLWDVAGVLLATAGAERLGLVSHEALLRRCARVLEHVARMELIGEPGIHLPNQFYRIDSLSMGSATGDAGKPVGWTVTDIGTYLLVGEWLVGRFPPLRPAWERSIERWTLDAAVDSGRPRGWRLASSYYDESAYPYGVLASEGLRRRGLPMVSHRPTLSRSVHGVTVRWELHGRTTLEPFLYAEVLGSDTGQQLPFDDRFQDLARAQELHYSATGVLTAASETPLDIDPYYAYYCTVSGHEEAPGEPFVVVAREHVERAAQLMEVVSSRVALAGAAFAPSPYWDRLARLVRDTLVTDRGVRPGFYAVGAYPVLTRDLNTNAMTLAILARSRSGVLAADR